MDLYPDLYRSVITDDIGITAFSDITHRYHSPGVPTDRVTDGIIITRCPCYVLEEKYHILT